MTGYEDDGRVANNVRRYEMAVLFVKPGRGTLDGDDGWGILWQ